jgi:hypothetical protein
MRSARPRTVRRCRGRIICTMLEMPAARGLSPRAVAAARVLRSRRSIKISVVTSAALALRSVLPLSRLSRSLSLPIADLVLACVGCTRDTVIYGEKRTSGSATIRGNCLRENPRLSDDGIRGNPPLLYDVASDAGVGAKSGPCANVERWAPGNCRYWYTVSADVRYTRYSGGHSG